ncbi:MAG: hypothetical protein CL666_04660 [Balneola sp.]|nr:hypothetical protein [Balneola sp.]|tara:strand:+ start:42222 stop:42434 length:213 start_codon:yes stop_codon:yes gene_type:complete
METYIITLKWNGGDTAKYRKRFESRDLANQYGQHLKQREHADELFVSPLKSVLAVLMNKAEISTKPIPVL